MKKILCVFLLIPCLIFTTRAYAEEWREVREFAEAVQEGYIQVVGESEAGQSRYKALRAATVVAQRDLLEIIKGISVSGKTKVVDGMLERDEISTSVEGMLKGAERCGKKYDETDRHAEVCMRVNLRGANGVYNAILPLIKGTSLVPPEGPVYTPGADTPASSMSTPVQVAKAEVKYDGLIIDVTEHGFRPALINRILSEKEEIIFDPSKIESSILVDRGCGGFTNDPGKAKALLSTWGCQNPFSIKASGVVRSTDVKVSANDASLIYENNQKSNFLPEAKVVFVLK
ncbi:hypothetical protein JXL19_05955 [bacterium]|nr:hypothetical protein [bacterium]